MTSVDSWGTIRRGRSVLSQALDEETVLLDLERGHYFCLNQTGTQIWSWLGDDGATLGHLVDRLSSEYRVSRSKAEADLVALLTDLHVQGLIEHGPA